MSLVSIRLFVFVRREALPAVSHLQTGTRGTGLGNVYGNKGGAAVAFHFYDTSICLINTHLAARPERINERNMDFADIVSDLAVGRKGLEVSDQFDHVFFFGDLNYRVELPFDEAADGVEAFAVAGVDSAARAAAIAPLLAKDQLRAEQAAGRTLDGFEEGPIHFCPTYRWECGTTRSGRAALSNKKGQAPSWCDRILRRSLPACAVRQLTYEAASEITDSDHTPVSATYEIHTRLPAVHVGGAALTLRLTQLRLEVSPAGLQYALAGQQGRRNRGSMCAVAPACAAAVSAPATPSATPRAPDAPTAAAAADAAAAELGERLAVEELPLFDAARGARGRRRRVRAFKVVLRRCEAGLDAEGVIDDVEALVGQRLHLADGAGTSADGAEPPAFERRLSDELLVAAAEAAAAAEAHEAATLEAQQTAKAVSPTSARLQTDLADRERTVGRRVVAHVRPLGGGRGGDGA